MNKLYMSRVKMSKNFSFRIEIKSKAKVNTLSLDISKQPFETFLSNALSNCK